MPEQTLYDDSQKTIGFLELEREENNTKVFVIPHAIQRTIATDVFAHIDDELEEEGVSQKWHLLNIYDDGLVQIYPFKNWEVRYFLPKYDTLKSITLEGFGYETVTSADEVVDLISSFPKAIVKTYSFGLGLKKEYTSFINELEKLGIQHLEISKKGLTEILSEEKKCIVKLSEFEEIRRSMDRVTKHAQKVANIVKSNASYNTLSFFLKNDQFPQKPLTLEDGIIAKMMAKAAPAMGAGLARAEKKEALDFIAKNTLHVLKQEPERLIRLKNDIELATLEELIAHFEKKLAEGGNESGWQKLFNDNPFILNMAFGYPVIKIQGQASVGGRKFSGDGDKITDFLVKNNLSNNLALFEIKKPGAKLLSKTAYREGVFGPSSELTGAVSQMLDQKNHIQRHILALKDNSKVYDLETFAVHGVLVIGRSPIDFDEQKSFELYRGNSKDIAIVTFDELLEKLKQLHLFIRQPSS